MRQAFAKLAYKVKKICGFFFFLITQRTAVTHNIFIRLCVIEEFHVYLLSKQNVMILRNATPNDVETIVGFQIKMALETEDLTLEPDAVGKGVSAVFTDTSKGRYFVAEEEGAVVASLMVTYEWSDWRNGLIWWIQSVYVMPEFRKRGVFAQLYHHLKKQVETSADIRGLRLYVDKRNVSAQKVYTKLGMNGSHYDTYEWMRNF